MTERTNKLTWQADLLDNLRHRFEYNDHTKLWKLSGMITGKEYEAFREAITSLRVRIGLIEGDKK